MSVITFDTIEYCDDLISAGVPESQAKAQSKALKRVVDDVVGGELTTKADLYKVELRLIKWMIGVNAAMFGLLFALFKLLA